MLYAVGIDCRRPYAHRGVLWKGLACGRLDADDGSVQCDRVCGRTEVLAPQSAPFAWRIRTRRVSLPDIDEACTGSIASRRIKSAVGTERNVTYRVVRIVLIPVL